MSQTLEQKRAQYAHSFITQDCENVDRAKLLTLIRKTPTMIIQNGLGQSLAFLLADAGDNRQEASYQLYSFMQTWLCKEGQPARVYTGDADLISQLIKNQRSDYIRAQQEILALFNWLKKFADAWL